MPAQKTKPIKYLSIGQIEARTGLAVSAIRYYEAEELVHPIRNTGGQRQFQRADIRRISFIMIAQKLGFSLAQIRKQLNTLPKNRAPTQKDWERISTVFRAELEERLELLSRTLEKLDKCIGCGCLSLKACSLYNEDDLAGVLGTGPRFLMGDEPQTNQAEEHQNT